MDVHTREMEMEARAKGSPMMLPALNRFRLESMMFMLYFFNDGECREPYEGIEGGSKVAA
jgi:hypothetical protein